jgi:hypothetical protein
MTIYVLEVFEAYTRDEDQGEWNIWAAYTERERGLNTGEDLIKNEEMPLIKDYTLSAVELNGEIKL